MLSALLRRLTAFWRHWVVSGGVVNGWSMCKCRRESRLATKSHHAVTLRALHPAAMCFDLVPHKDNKCPNYGHPGLSANDQDLVSGSPLHTTADCYFLNTSCVIFSKISTSRKPLAVSPTGRIQNSFPSPHNAYHQKVLN